jgi:UBX domain-containing protein 1
MAGFKSFSDLLRENGDDGEDRNTFAGGETSGLEIQDPKKQREQLLKQLKERSENEQDENSKSILQKLLEKAEQAGSMDDMDESEDELSQEQNFGGSGQRLGGITDPTVQSASSDGERASNSILQKKSGKVNREITFWADGFTLGHDPTGKLYRYDDETNAHYLKELDQGRAPLSLLDVEIGQRVDVTVKKNTDQKYVKPKTVGGFEGQGSRLGSEIPSELPDMVEIPKATKPLDEDEIARRKETTDDETKLQIRYANGSKEVYICSVKTSIRDLYNYVKQGGKFNTPVDQAFTINHVFPLKPLIDLDKTLEDEGLKNSAVVQRWVL